MTFNNSQAHAKACVYTFFAHGQFYVSVSRTCDPEDVRVMIEDRDGEQGCRVSLDGFGHSFSILMNFPFYPFFYFV